MLASPSVREVWRAPLCPACHAVSIWKGTEDRTLSFVGKGEYSATTGVYEVHTMAPDPLPENTMWWIEIEKTHGTKVLGSAQPVM